MVPAGWDSWGKIIVLREGFDPAAMERGWREILERMIGGESQEAGLVGGKSGVVEGLAGMWEGMIPDAERGVKVGQSI
jgi:dynein light intermediate chain 1